MSEASQFFEGGGKVQQSLRAITKQLDDLGIPYAVVGGMGVFAHGLRRFTEDIDILVTRESLRRIHHELDGRGYVRPFEKSKNLRDATTGVKIEFLLAGDYPGDGKPKPVAFPLPEEISEQIDGIKYGQLRTLIELKLASGMTNSDRKKDLADVQELIKLASLPLDYSSRLHEFVRLKYEELWRDAHGIKKRFELLWRNKWLTARATTLEEMIQMLTSARDQLASMLADGVKLSADGSTGDDYAQLYTYDPEVAAKYGMEPEEEFFDEDDNSEVR